MRLMNQIVVIVIAFVAPASVAIAGADVPAGVFDPGCGRIVPLGPRAADAHPSPRAPRPAAAVIGYTTGAVISHYRALDHNEIALGVADLVGEGHELVPVNALTPQNVEDLDVLVVGVVNAFQTLSGPQLEVVEDFVLAGGTLVFLGENNRAFRDNNVALGARFGLTFPGSDPPETTLNDVPEPRHPIMDGPFGAVDTIDGSKNSGGAYGSILSPGPGRSILDFPGGNSGGVVIERGQIAPGSGLVIAVAEVNVWDQSEYNKADNRAYFRNIFEYAAGGGLDCDAIKKFKNKCKNGKLKATVKSDLEEGTVLHVSNNGEPTIIVIDARGKGKLKAKGQGDVPHDMVIDECPDRACTLPNCSGGKCNG